MTGLTHHGVTCGDGAALERLRRLGGSALVSEMMATFLERVPPMLAVARDATECGDLVSLKFAAGLVRTSCGPLGAVAMRELSARVERAASALDLAPVPTLLDELDEELERVRGWFEVVRDQLPGAA